MRTRSALGPGALASSSQAAASSRLVATQTTQSQSTSSAPTESRRELRPRRAAEIRGAPPGATAPHAAPRISGRVTRGLAAKIQADSGSSSTDESFSSPPPPASSVSQLSYATRASTGRPRRLGRSSHNLSGPASNLHTRNTRLRKRSRPSGFYDEDSDAQELDIDNGNSYLSPTPGEEEVQPTPTTPALRTTPRTSSRFKKAKVFKSPRREKVKVPSPPPVSDGLSTETAHIPPWTSLPYYSLVQIFEYAAALLNEREGVDWLLSTSRICRAFAEPAITALYRCPALLSRPMAHNLATSLSKDPSTTMFNYRVKVEKLRIDVGDIAAKSYKGEHMDFGALVSNLPRLKVIDFYHNKDEAPYRRLDDNLRWHYPGPLFEALNGTREAETEIQVVQKPARLIGWRWNRRMMGPDLDLDGIKSLHLTPAFAHLKRLAFVNFQVPSLHSRNDNDPEIAAQDQEFIQGVANAISALPDLEHLSMASSTVVNEHFLPLLPKTLKTLELINCWDINGEDFASYLLSHGKKLRDLYLHHNQSLNLAFLTVLGAACPQLRTLRMDLKTYNHHEFYKDSDPSYEHVLTPDQVPHWPETLETLELKNMRKWEAEGAEVLFQSLVDSAPVLPKLRYLGLKTMLDIPFRQRSELRDKWEARLKRVFLRKVADPSRFRSLRRPHVEDAAESSPKSRKAQKNTTAESPSRRSGRIATQLSHPSSRASSMGRDLRKSSQGRPSYAEPDTDDDELAPEESEEEIPDSRPSTPSERITASTPLSPSTGTDFFHHGMCEKVEIQLDNQKPTERTLTMADFLDDEVSDDPSDEDWDGDEDIDTGYAW